ncbi:MAG: DUF3429 domain-containing protein [Pseudomonadota bacterium]|nr:DUF3429 domain-containing protein [Pseudomonadota bacterium]
MTDNLNLPLPRGMPALAWSGVLPFALAVVAAIVTPTSAGFAAAVFISYGAVILSFLGGARWGRALATGAGLGRFVEAILPSLIGFSALLLLHVTWVALSLLATGFAIWLVIDQRDALWSPAYKRMRLGISLAVLVLHAAWLVI